MMTPPIETKRLDNDDAKKVSSQTPLSSSAGNGTQRLRAALNAFSQEASPTTETGDITTNYNTTRAVDSSSPDVDDGGISRLRSAPRDYRMRSYRQKRPIRQRPQISTGEAFAIERQDEEEEQQQYPGAYSVPGFGGRLNHSHGRGEQEMEEEETGQTSTNLGDSKHPKFRWIHILIIAVLVVIAVSVTAIVVSISKKRSSNNNVNESEPTIKDRMAYLRNTLADLSSRGTSVWDDDLFSPQSQALQWLAVEDVGSNVSLLDTERLITRYVLAVLYFSTSNGTDAWGNDSYAFLAPFHECDWKSSVYQTGVSCDASLRVTRITIDGNQLRGVIPEELGSLFHLEALSLRQNYLSGSLPKTLFALSKLTLLDLSENILVSTISTEIGRLSNLQILRLGNNQLSGSSFMDGIGLLTQLTEINMTRNQFDGKILENPRWMVYSTPWVNLANLEVIDFSHNSFSGLIGQFLAKELNQLQRFYIDGNPFQGIILPEFLRLRSLQVFSASGSQFTGTIPWRPNIPASNLTTIILSGNLFSEILPTTFGSQFSRLQYLDLSNNRLQSSSIPESIGELTNLKSFLMSGSELTGTLPSSFGQLRELQTLDLHKNQLYGTIPMELSTCSELEDLRLQDNHLSGTLPEEFSTLSNLRRATIQGNDLTGSVEFMCPVLDESKGGENTTIMDETDVFGMIGVDCLGDNPPILACSCCQCHG